MARKLLVIDDSKIMHPLVRARLVPEGLEIHSAYDGESGLVMAGAVPPDVILLDVDMPGVSGFEVCERLKADPATRDIPVIFITGSKSTDDKIKGLDKGAVDYVTKPFEPAELLARVRVALRVKQLTDLLAATALTDGLTGLRNRTYLDERLAAEVSLSRRDGRPLACVLADLDHFKPLNDEHGHLFGDDVLRGTAGILRQACRAEDVVCRYGGEEFILLLPGTTLDGAHALAERIRSSLAATTFAAGDKKAAVTGSFGVAMFESEDDPHRILHRADQALYQAKARGRNAVVLADSSRVAGPRDYVDSDG